MHAEIHKAMKTAYVVQEQQIKPTPGPWATGDADWRTIVGPTTRYKPVGDDCVSLACVATVDVSTNEAQDLANARLIASAPELLSCLEAINATINAGHLKFSQLMLDQRPSLVAEILDSIRSAITRATGANQ